jgi:hypothetical protein
MNSARTKILLGAAFALALSPAVLLLGPTAAAQQPPAGAPAGAPHQWHGKPGTAPTQAPQSVAPQTAPATGAPAAVHPVPPSASIPGKKTPAGEQFFIVASVDLQKTQLLLKYPTEVTLLVLVNNATKFTDENGKALKLSDFRAGDTVWMVSSPAGPGEATALRIRKGQMTVADLHRYYLDYAEIK